MAEHVRIEIGFDGGQSLSMLVSPESANDSSAASAGRDPSPSTPRMRSSS
jgi:hypothetical protein